MRTLVAGLSFWLVGAAGALANPPIYTPGEVFVFDNGRVEHVREVNGQRVTWAARSGRTYVRSANPVVPILEWRYRGQTGERVIRGDPDRLWPLRPGATARFQTLNIARMEDTGRTRRSVHLWTCRVGSMEQVDTPAGDFDAYPIVCDRFSPNSMRVLERITWRFAPDVGHYVAREARNMRTGEAESFRLFAALPARESNVARIEALARQAQRRAAEQ
jgi:hypothetical protein